MIESFIIMAFLTGYFLGGLSFCLHAHRKGWFKASLPSAGDSLANIADEAYEQKMPGELSKPNADFAVTGKPRAIPWHIRRKALEAAARTKRKRLESFQEYV